MNEISLVNNNPNFNCFRKRERPIIWDDTEIIKIPKTEFIQLEHAELAQLYCGSRSKLDENTTIYFVDSELDSNCKYVGGGLLRQLLDRTSCDECIGVLIEYVGNGEVRDLFIKDMEFSKVNEALLEPSPEFLNVMYHVVTVYMSSKYAIPSLSLTRSIVNDLVTLATEFLIKKDVTLKFCPSHIDCYTRLIVKSLIKTMLSRNMNRSSDDLGRKEMRNMAKKAKSTKSDILRSAAKAKK